MDGRPTELHPLIPFIPTGAKVLMCGTFPPKRDKWSMEFFYPNFINDMWRIFGYILYGDKEYFVDTEHKTFDVSGIKRMLTELGIAVFDTATEVYRAKDNASDKYLEIITPIDLSKILAELPGCKAIVSTGEKAAGVISSITNTCLPKLGESVEISIYDNSGQTHVIRHYRMPSSSRAYPMKLERKADYYHSMLEEIGIL